MNSALNRAPFEEYQERIATGGYTPGDDAYNMLGIGFDGGGMSTAHNVGFASTLKQEGIIAVADIVVGTSAGAKVAAATLSDQLYETEQIFLKHLVERRFINLWRILSDGKVPAMNLPMLNGIISNEIPLDTENINKSPIVLGIGVTDITNFRPVAISSRTSSGKEITKALMKSIHMPWVAGKPPKENDTVWADGGLSWMSTSDVAIELGAHRVVEISNNPASRWKHHNIASAFVSLWIRKHGSLESAKSYITFTKEQVNFMNNRHTNPNITQIYPKVDISLLPGTLCNDIKLLRQGFAIGQETARAALGYESDIIPTHPEARKSLKRIIGNIAASSRTIVPLGI